MRNQAVIAIFALLLLTLALFLAQRHSIHTFSAYPATGIVPLDTDIAFDYSDATEDRTYIVEFGDGSSAKLEYTRHLCELDSMRRYCTNDTSGYYGARHTYQSAGKYVAQLRNGTGMELGTVTISLTDRPTTKTLTIPGTVTLSIRQMAARSIGSSQDVLELDSVDTRYTPFDVGILWRHRNCSTEICGDVEPRGEHLNGVMGATLSTNSRTLTTNEGLYEITLIAVTPTTATFQISPSGGV